MKNDKKFKELKLRHLTCHASAIFIFTMDTSAIIFITVKLNRTIQILHDKMLYNIPPGNAHSRKSRQEYAHPGGDKEKQAMGTRARHA